MELKKSAKADLQNKRALFLEIGLAASLLIVFVAFAWSQKEKVVDIPDPEYAPVEEEAIEITRQDRRQQPIRQQIQVLSDLINIVKDDTKITTEIKFDEFTEDAIIVEVSSNSISDIVDFGDEVFTRVEEEPLFQGKSWETFPVWVMENIKYPENARRNNIQGRVMVGFIIEKDGTLSNIEVLSDTDEDLNREAVRVIKSSPKWTPARQLRRPVRMRYQIPVTFRLN